MSIKQMGQRVSTVGLPLEMWDWIMRLSSTGDTTMEPVPSVIHQTLLHFPSPCPNLLPPGAGKMHQVD